jgi:hypothetical protein
MLLVCLHQLVLHAELQHGATNRLPVMRADSSIAAGCGLAYGSSNTSRSIADIAEGCLLQHADTLQAKQPAGTTSRAAIAAWRGLCERHWAAGSLQLTPQEAAAVLASIQPSAAAASSSGGVGDAGTAATAVWAMQDCGRLDGSFGWRLESHHGSAGIRPPAFSSTITCSTGVGTRCCDSSRAAQSLPAVPVSEPILSISSCAHKATALSSVCYLVACKSPAGSIADTCQLVGTLLAAAAAAVSLQGAAALSLVYSLTVAAIHLLSARPLSQQHAQLTSAEQRHGTTPSHQSGGCVPGSGAHLPTIAARQAASTPTSVSDLLLLCLSLAADLTKSVLQLEADPALQSPQELQNLPFGSSLCAQVQLGLLWHICGQGFAADPGTQLRQFQSVAYTLQLVEAVARHAAVWEKAHCMTTSTSAANAVRHPPGQQQRQTVSHSYMLGYGAARSAVQLLSSAGQAMLGSVQGQQMLQSCTSLLLTCSSIVHSRQHDASPADLALSAKLLQLLVRSEAASARLAAAGAHGSSCTVSRSLAAGLALAGRDLVALGSSLSLDSTVDTACVHYAGASLLEYRSRVHEWLSSRYLYTLPAGSLSIPAAGILTPESMTDISRAQVSVLHQALQDLLGCVQSINQALQQQAAAAASTAPIEQASSKHSSSAHSSGTVSSSSSSSSIDSAAEGHRTVSSAACGAQNRDPGHQHQHAATAAAIDGLLVGLITAQSRLEDNVLHLGAALAPYLQQGVDPLSAPASTSLLSLCKCLCTAGEALCAAVPSSACCSNPRCTNLDGVSAGFALVRGKGCVCGGCLGLQSGVAAAVPCQRALKVAAR